MVHLGKRYPYWQISRMFAPEFGWPGLAPTEFAYVLTTPTGYGASGVSTSGRGFTPLVYNQGDETLTYQGNVGSFGGLEYILQRIDRLQTGSVAIAIDVQLFWGTTMIGRLASLIAWNYGWDGDPWISAWPGWDNLGGAWPITNIAVETMTPVPWTASPPPPNSHIF